MGLSVELLTRYLFFFFLELSSQSDWWTAMSSSVFLSFGVWSSILHPLALVVSSKWLAGRKQVEPWYAMAADPGKAPAVLKERCGWTTERLEPQWRDILEREGSPWHSIPSRAQSLSDLTSNWAEKPSEGAVSSQNHGKYQENMISYHGVGECRWPGNNRRIDKKGLTERCNCPQIIFFPTSEAISS